MVRIVVYVYGTGNDQVELLCDWEVFIAQCRYFYIRQVAINKKMLAIFKQPGSANL